jgi:hypothetical protein
MFVIWLGNMCCGSTKWWRMLGMLFLKLATGAEMDCFAPDIVTKHVFSLV